MAVTLSNGPEATDKTGKEWKTPVEPHVAEALRRLLKRRPHLGAPLFPSPRDANRPVLEDSLRNWVRKAIDAAGLPRLPHDSFHGLRRKWATERKHLPDVDVAQAGGWRSIQVMKRSYQQADEAGVWEAITSPRRYMEGK